MIVEAQVTLNGSRTAVWDAMTDMENAASIISGIKKIEVVNKPASGIVGLRWKETRVLFGDDATVEKWVTEAVENSFFKTRAESDGFVFLSDTRISDASDGSLVLTTAHDSQPQGFVAKVKALPMVFFRGVIRKALLQDLNDLKAAVEAP